MNCPYCHKKTPNEAMLCVHCGKYVQKRISRNQHKAIKCPTCDIKTDVINFENIYLDFCHQCSGIWFDKNEMNGFQKNIEQKDASRHFLPILDEIGTGLEEKKRKTYLKCPLCREVMKRNNYHDLSGIILDQCAIHGTWAEKQDLEKIVDLIVSGEIEMINQKASTKRQQNLDKKLQSIEIKQKQLQIELAHARRFSSTHLVLDLLGIL